MGEFAPFCRGGIRVQDGFGRKIDYLRVSVTDRCNLRCFYCLPEEGVASSPQGDILSLEELLELIRVATENGIRRIRITGGEPLLRRGLVPLLAQVKALPGVEDLSLTTNGLLLEEGAAQLRRAGVDRLNFSLDTLRPERFREITRGGELGKVLRGIERAEREGFSPLKVNMVLMRQTADEIPEFLRLTRDRPLHVRFIELMPVGAGSGKRAEHLPMAEAWRELEPLQPIPTKVEGGGPATYYRIPGALGTVGFIGAVSNNFCGDCRRIRLGANGFLHQCLAEEGGIDLRGPLRQGISRKNLGKLFQQAVFAKPKEGTFRWEIDRCRAMSRIGG